MGKRYANFNSRIDPKRGRNGNEGRHSPPPVANPKAHEESEGAVRPIARAVFDIFRRWGYLQSWLDPLGQYLPPEPFPVSVPEGEAAVEARRYYCGTFGVEFMHIPNSEQRQWLQEKLEQPAVQPDQAHVLSKLIHADVFEQVIQARYLGTKRFSLEGLSVLIPFLDQVLATGATGRRRDDGIACDGASRAI